MFTVLWKVYVVDQHESLQRGEELPLNITLSHYVSNAPAAPGCLVVDPSSCVISKSGNVSVEDIFAAFVLCY